MKKYRFLKKALNIKQESLGKMIDACIALPESDRASVSQYSGVSLVTAGKLLSALDECRFTKTVYKHPEGGRPIKIHRINDDLTATVIDLSSPYCSVSVIKSDGAAVFYKRYNYPTGIALKEGILAALSRACLEIKDLDLTVSAICTILADDTCGTRAALTLRDKDWLEVTVATIFGIAPTAQLTFSEALTSALRYGRMPTAAQTNVAYICIGDVVKLCFLPESSSPVICKPQDLLISDVLTVTDALDEMISPSDFAKLLSRVVNLAHCAFSPQEYLIEYDGTKFGGKAHYEIKRSFAMLSKEAPTIYTRDHRSSVAHLGAAALVASEFIKLYITTADKQKTSEDA